MVAILGKLNICFLKEIFAKPSFVHWESKISRQTWRCKIFMWFTDAYIKNCHWKILMWFTEAYIKYIFVKLILKIFTFENSKGKGQNILPRPRGCSLGLFFRPVHLAKSLLLMHEKLFFKAKMTELWPFCLHLIYLDVICISFKL